MDLKDDRNHNGASALRFVTRIWIWNAGRRKCSPLKQNISKLQLVLVMGICCGLHFYLKVLYVKKKNGPPVTFILKTNRGQTLTAAYCSCPYLISSVSHAASGLDWELRDRQQHKSFAQRHARASCHTIKTCVFIHILFTFHVKFRIFSAEILTYCPLSVLCDS